MEPQSHTKATLVDLLDRVLDKGLVIHADLVVSVAGIPLIGVNLKAALAGMETMVKYGMMKEWDKRIRAQEYEARSRNHGALANGEEILFTALGAWYCSEGLHPAWRYGHLYLTSERLFVYQHPFDRMLFEVPSHSVTHLFVPEDQGEDNHRDHELHLVMDDGRIEKLHSREAPQLQIILEDQKIGAGVVLDSSVWKSIWHGTRDAGDVTPIEIVCIDE